MRQTGWVARHPGLRGYASLHGRSASQHRYWFPWSVLPRDANDAPRIDMPSCWNSGKSTNAYLAAGAGDLPSSNASSIAVASNQRAPASRGPGLSLQRLQLRSVAPVPGPWGNICTGPEPEIATGGAVVKQGGRWCPSSLRCMFLTRRQSRNGCERR